MLNPWQYCRLLLLLSSLGNSVILHLSIFMFLCIFGYLLSSHSSHYQVACIDLINLVHYELLSGGLDHGGTCLLVFLIGWVTVGLDQINGIGEVGGGRFFVIPLQFQRTSSLHIPPQFQPVIWQQLNLFLLDDALSSPDSW